MDTRILAQRITALEAQVKAYAHSHLGVLSGPAIRYELSQMTTPCDILVFDWRKQAEWNAVLGWNPSNVFLSQAARIDYAGIDMRHATRQIDLRGQFGGDEIAMAVDVGDGIGLLGRLLRELVVMNRALSPAQIADIGARTGGLISGFGVAAVLVQGSTHALRDTLRAVDATGVLKAGVQTGARATSGARGTVIGRLEA